MKCVFKILLLTIIFTYLCDITFSVSLFLRGTTCSLRLCSKFYWTFLVIMFGHWPKVDSASLPLSENLVWGWCNMDSPLPLELLATKRGGTVFANASSCFFVGVFTLWAFNFFSCILMAFVAAPINLCGEALLIFVIPWWCLWQHPWLIVTFIITRKIEILIKKIFIL